MSITHASRHAVRVASVAVLATLTSVLISSCSNITDTTPSEPLLAQARALADQTGCTERIELHADLYAYPALGGVSCELDRSPVIVRVYETPSAAVRALNDLAPLVVNGTVAIAGDAWIALIPDTRATAFLAAGPDRTQLSTADLEQAQHLSPDSTQDDLDFCVRWATSQLQTWIQNDQVTDTPPDLPPQLTVVAAAVVDIQRQQQPQRPSLADALNSNVWEYESKISEVLAPVRAACAQSFPTPSPM